MWNITLLWLFCCPVLGILYFSHLRPGWTPGRILTIYSPRMCLLGLRMTTHNIKGFKTPKKGAWLGIFQPNWQNYKIVISPAGNIGSIPNFDRVIEPHSWLRRWSRVTKFKMANSRRIAKCWKRYNLPINGPIWMKLGWWHPIMSPTCPPCWSCHRDGRTDRHICYINISRQYTDAISRQYTDAREKLKLVEKQ